MKYVISINLETNRQLLRHELAYLVDSLELQLEEPQVFDNEPANWNPTSFSTVVSVVVKL